MNPTCRVDGLLDKIIVKTTCVSDIFYQKLQSRYRESKKPLEKTKRQWAGGEIEVEERK